MCEECEYKRWCEIDQDYTCTNRDSVIFGEEVRADDGCEKGSVKQAIGNVV